MRIETIEALVVRFPASIPKPGPCRRCPAFALDDCGSVLIRVATRSGLVGWGESQALTAPSVAATVVRSVLLPLLRNLEFGGAREEIEALWERMYRLMRRCGQTGGFMLDGISGVDLALWDLAGKMHGVSVSRMMAGSAARQDLAVAPPVLYLEGDPRAVLERVNANVAVHGLWQLEPAGAAELGRELDRKGALWLDCPFPPEQVAPHAQLAAAMHTPIAIGESYRTAYELAPFFERGAVGVVRPNLGRCGITEGLRIARRAAACGVEVVPHLDLSAGPLAAATLHFAAALPNCSMTPCETPLLRALGMLATRPAMHAGRVCTPAGPGLGLTPDEAELQMAQASGMWNAPADRVAVLGCG